MTLLKKSKNPKLIPKLDITLLILGLNQLIPVSRVAGPGGDSPPVKKKVKKYARAKLSDLRASGRLLVANFLAQ